MVVHNLLSDRITGSVPLPRPPAPSQIGTKESLTDLKALCDDDIVLYNISIFFLGV
jgi:hypothetical protein